MRVVARVFFVFSCAMLWATVPNCSMVAYPGAGTASENMMDELRFALKKTHLDQFTTIFWF